MSEHLYMMRRYANGVPNYAPLCVHSFRLIAPRKLKEAQTFNAMYHVLSDIHNLPDRLRWCRHHAGLSRKAFARLLGVSDSSVRAWESGRVQVSRQSWEKHFKDKL